jgi:hypothetical protein
MVKKALVYLTNSSKAIFVPKAPSYGVLLSPSDPDGLVASLKSNLKQE